MLPWGRGSRLVAAVKTPRLLERLLGRRLGKSESAAPATAPWPPPSAPRPPSSATRPSPPEPRATAATANAATAPGAAGAADTTAAAARRGFIPTRPVQAGQPALPTPAPPLLKRADPRDAAAAPALGRFIGREWQSRHGNRSYRLFEPALPPGAAAPALVVMLHGCTQDAADFAVGTRMNEAAARLGFLVLYPEQDSGANGQRCWNWFKAEHQHSHQGEPALLAELVRHVVTAHGVDRRRVHVAGLSAGAAMAALLGDLHPELFASVASHSGVAPGVARGMVSALRAMHLGPPRHHPGHVPRLPTLVIQGQRDAVVHAANADAFRAPVDATPTTYSGETWSDQIWRDAAGQVRLRKLTLRAGIHGWAGGSAVGRFTQPDAPDATLACLRFFGLA